MNKHERESLLDIHDDDARVQAIASSYMYRLPARKGVLMRATSKFKAGDRVRCIEAPSGCIAQHLVNGEIYTVESSVRPYHLQLESVVGWWSVHRFGKVLEPVHITTFGAPVLLEPEPTENRADAPSYGGWSEGDVMAYLSRFGDVLKSGNFWYVERRPFFGAQVMTRPSGWQARITCVASGEVVADTLPKLMAAALAEWRRLVAESDPEGLPPTEWSGESGRSRLDAEIVTRFIGTGHMGGPGTGGHR